MLDDVRDKTRGSQRRRGQINGDVTSLSQTCRRRYREVGIVEFGLCCADRQNDQLTAGVDSDGGAGLAQLVRSVVADHPELVGGTTRRRRP